MGRLTTALVSSLALFSSISHAVNEVTIQGQDFVDTKTNQRLVLLGIDYQPGGQAGYKPESGEDALSNGQVCLRDAAILQSLGVNTIRVYNIAPSINHDECMSIFNVAGIYVVLDVNAPFAGESLDRDNPSGTYDASYLNRTFQVVEAFKNFPNTLAFFAGNEVVNDVPTAKDNPPYIRAIQRDIKQYIKQNADRSIPVGYSAADVRPILEDTWNYFRCAINGNAAGDTSRSDFFGLNSYSWCGSMNTFQTSTYDQLAAMFQDSNIPVFFSEYGCNKVRPRTFPEVSSLYGKQMTMLSGGLVYEYSQEDADYGLVQINGNKTVSLLVDFDNLQKQYNSLDTNLLQSANQTATDLSPPRCSSSLITSSSFSKSFNVPSQPDDIASLISNGVPNAAAIQGKLVDVNDLNSPYAVYSSSGEQLPTLKITAVSSQNAPNGGSTGGSSGSSSSSGDNQGAAARFGGNGAEAMMAMAVAMGVWLFLN